MVIRKAFAGLCSGSWDPRGPACGLPSTGRARRGTRPARPRVQRPGPLERGGASRRAARRARARSLGESQVRRAYLTRAILNGAGRAGRLRWSFEEVAVKSQYRVVVIGGGVVGASVLYHLAKFGWDDAALMERSMLAAGSSWHAAGGVHALNADPNMAGPAGLHHRSALRD